MIEKILQSIFPASCIVCEKISNEYICPKCYYFLKQEITFTKIRIKDFSLYYLALYERKIRKLILKYKFSDCAYISKGFIEIMLKDKEFVEEIKKYDYIIPVPMYWENRKKRGYNQTELIAKEIKKIFKIDVLDNILIKSIKNKRQSELTQKERKNNVKNVYNIINEEKILNKKILLIDDIYTTGNTIFECRKTLLKGKPKVIDAFVLAKRN